MIFQVTNLPKLLAKLERITKDRRKRMLTAALKSAYVVEGAAKANIQSGPKTGRVYERGNITHRASAPGQSPATDTGALVRSIRVSRDDDGATVAVGAEYGAALEFGRDDGTIKERPFLRPALVASIPTIKALFAEAARGD